MEIQKLATILVQLGAFISAFAAIAAGIIMGRFTKKFGDGILSSGFKTISIGIFLIAIGIIFDAVQVYFFEGAESQFLNILMPLREVFFVLGTYIVVIGSKKTGDKLENLANK